MRPGARRYDSPGSTPIRRRSRRPKRLNAYRHFELGKPAQLWKYQYANGAFACYVARWNVPGEEGEEKNFRPLILENRQWKAEGPSRT